MDMEEHRNARSYSVIFYSLVTVSLTDGMQDLSRRLLRTCLSSHINLCASGQFRISISKHITADVSGSRGWHSNTE